MYQYRVEYFSGVGTFGWSTYQDYDTEAEARETVYWLRWNNNQARWYPVRKGV